MLLLDHSAWSRIRSPKLDEDRLAWFAEYFEYEWLAPAGTI
jgi:predicted nucleic acid-binding protein